MNRRDITQSEADMLLTAQELVELTGLSRSKVYEMIATGELPSIRTGRSVRVSLAAYRRWINQRDDATTSVTVLADAMATRLRRVRS